MPIALLKAALFLIIGAAVLAPAPQALAQNPFAPAIKVNDEVITEFEIDQRARLLTLFRAPGDTRKLARKQLVEDRLKEGAAKAAGIVIDDATIQAAMEDFAQRAKMTAEKMIASLAKAGVEKETFRNFVRAGVTWRELIRSKFANKVSVNEDDIERAKLALSESAGIKVLLSEIVLPVRPGQEAQLRALANDLAKIDNARDFSDAARRYSAAPSASRGGRMDWIAISKLPEPLRPVVLALSPGEVSDPVTTKDAVILLQMRDIAETAVPRPSYSAIEYAIYLIDGGRSEAALKRAAAIKAQVDTCDDLYGVAKGQPPEILQRESKAPGEIPPDIAHELEKLDPGEVSTALTRNNGKTLVFLMLCGRTPEIKGEGPSAEELTNFIRNRRLESYAAGYLEELRAEARIVNLR